MNFEERSQEPEEMAANQEEWDSTSDSDITELLKILDDIDAYVEDEIAEYVEEMQYAEENKSENYMCDNYEKFENIHSSLEELLKELREELEAVQKKLEEIRKQQRDWNKLKKKRIDKVYIGIEVECKFLRNLNIDTWFAIKPLIEDKGVYIGIQVPCKFLRKTFKLGL